jgi:hypothetical protein
LKKRIADQGKQTDAAIKRRQAERKEIKKSGKASKDVRTAEQKAWDESTKKAKQYMSVTSSGLNQVNSLLSAGGALVDAIYQKRIDKLDAQMEAELQAAGVADETTVEQAQREYDAAVETGDALSIEEKRRALEKAKIEEKFAKKRAQLEYKGALASWKFQMTQAAIGIPIATMQGLITGWGAGWPLGVVLGPLFAGLSGAAAALQLGAVAAAKPSPPKFATGGIIPGSAQGTQIIAGENNKSEAVLNQSQMQRFMDIADGKIGSAGQQINMIIDGTVFGKVMYRLSQNGDMLIDSGAITTK